MTKQTTKEDEQIRELLERWAHTTRMGLQDEILANHAKDVVIYDVLPPMKYEGAGVYRESWDEWQPETETGGLNLFDLHELTIKAGNEVAFAYSFIHCGGTNPDGETFEDWVRATFCLSKLDGKWKITHQHISKPLQ